MVNDLRTKTTLSEMFQEFPDLLNFLSIFTHGVEISTDAQGSIKNNEFLLVMLYPLGTRTHIQNG